MSRLKLACRLKRRVSPFEHRSFYFKMYIVHFCMDSHGTGKREIILWYFVGLLSFKNRRNIVRGAFSRYKVNVFKFSHRLTLSHHLSSAVWFSTSNPCVGRTELFVGLWWCSRIAAYTPALQCTIVPLLIPYENIDLKQEPTKPLHALVP